mgnify:CR=1 FL=1
MVGGEWQPHHLSRWNDVAIFFNSADFGAKTEADTCGQLYDAVYDGDFEKVKEITIQRSTPPMSTMEALDILASVQYPAAITPTPDPNWTSKDTSDCAGSKLINNLSIGCVAVDR